MKNINLVIITGLSGAGKSQAIRMFEDLGYFCIDNLPVLLIEKFIDICSKTEKNMNKIALVIDIRAGEFLEGFCNVMENLEEVGFDYDILFMEAKDEAIARRYSASRRKHPLEVDSLSIWESINKERKILKKIKERATVIVDTSDITQNELKNIIVSKFIKKEEVGKLLIRLYSFGYKYGIPLDADLVFDVRFLPNPFYVEELKNLNGNSSKVSDYVLTESLAKEFQKKFYDFMDFLLPKYILENKSYLTISIGCTGGKHRSVVLVNELQKYLNQQEYRINVIHRDIEKE